MHGDRRHLRPDVARQVRRRQRRQHRRRGRGAGQHRAPLEVARLRAGDRRALGVGVRRRPLAPRFVRRPGVARAREDFDLRAGRRVRAPGHHAPGRDEPRVLHVRLERAARRARRRHRHQQPGIRGRDERAIAGARDHRRLLRGHARHAAPRCTGSPLNRNSLPFAPVATSSAPSGSIATSYGASSFARPQLVPQPVGLHAIHGAGHGAAPLARRCRRPDCDAADIDDRRSR